MFDEAAVQRLSGIRPDRAHQASRDRRRSVALRARRKSVRRVFAQTRQRRLLITSPLTLTPLLHVESLDASIAFYEALGGRVVHRSRGGDWAQLAIGGAELGLLAHPPNPEQSEGILELCFTSDDSLATLESHLRACGVTIERVAADEAFGSQLQLRSPEGLLIKINRLEPETFS